MKKNLLFVSAALLAFSGSASAVTIIESTSTIQNGGLVITEHATVSEPETLVLLGLGTLGLMLASRRRRK